MLALTPLLPAQADERAVRDTVRQYCDTKLAPRIVQAWRNEDAAEVRPVMKEMGSMGMLGMALATSVTQHTTISYCIRLFGCRCDDQWVRLPRCESRHIRSDCP